MHQSRSAVKRRYHPKDWERRARIQEALYEKRLKVGDLALEIGINDGYLSSLIWGTQRSFSWETAIASALGRSWHELFSPEAEKVEGRAA
jgi:hypothetical protein